MPPLTSYVRSGPPPQLMQLLQQQQQPQGGGGANFLAQLIGGAGESAANVLQSYYDEPRAAATRGLEAASVMAPILAAETTQAYNVARTGQVEQEVATTAASELSKKVILEAMQRGVPVVQAVKEPGAENADPGFVTNMLQLSTATQGEERQQQAQALERAYGIFELAGETNDPEHLDRARQMALLAGYPEDVVPYMDATAFLTIAHQKFDPKSIALAPGGSLFERVRGQSSSGPPRSPEVSARPSEEGTVSRGGMGGQVDIPGFRQLKAPSPDPTAAAEWVWRRSTPEMEPLLGQYYRVNQRARDEKQGGAWGPMAGDKESAPIKGLESTMTKTFDEAIRARDSLMNLGAAMKSGQAKTGTVPQLRVWIPEVLDEFLVDQLPEGWFVVDARKTESIVRATRQLVGKMREGGVLRKEDEEKYKAMLVDIANHPEVAEYKLEEFTREAELGVWALVNQWEMAGFDVTRFRNQGYPEAPPHLMMGQRDAEGNLNNVEWLPYRTAKEQQDVYQLLNPGTVADKEYDVSGWEIIDYPTRVLLDQLAMKRLAPTWDPNKYAAW